MVKPAIAWDSVMVAPNGRVVAKTVEHAERGGQACWSPISTGTTPEGAPFTRFGGAPFQWLTYAATLVMLAAMVLSRRRS